MARKKLLSEGEIRQFMKLANLRPLGQGRLQEMYPAARDEDREEEEEVELEEPAPVDMDPAEDPGAEAEVAVDDVEAMGAPDDEPGDITISDEEARGLLDTLEASQELADMLRDALGAADADEGPPEDMDMGAPDDMEGDDMGAMMGDDDPAGARDYGGMMEEITRRVVAKLSPNSDEEVNPAPSEDQIVAEVAKRVARRLEKNKQKEDLADQLAERIMKRLTK